MALDVCLPLGPDAEDAKAGLIMPYWDTPGMTFRDTTT
jgi:hypothetical protein